MKELSAVEVERYRAECKFLRNLAYFFMVRIFGDVPYYTEAYAAAPLPRMDKTVVLKTCLADLQTVLIMTLIRVFCRGGMEVAACVPTGERY